MEDDKGEEGSRLGDPPRLVPMLAIVPIEVRDGDGVHGGNSQRHFVGQRAFEDVLGDVERVREGRLNNVGVRNWLRRRVWREFED